MCAFESSANRARDDVAPRQQIGISHAADAILDGSAIVEMPGFWKTLLGNSSSPRLSTATDRVEEAVLNVSQQAGEVTRLDHLINGHDC